MQEQAPPPLQPQPLEPEGQQNLRRSVRISVQGVTKRYSNVKPRGKKSVKDGNVELDLNQQTELLMALRKESLAVNPLQQLSTN